MILFALPALAAAAYYLLALAAAAFWPRTSKKTSSALPAISILKPVHGRDPRFYQAIRSHATQEYHTFEIVFGVSDPRDPALVDIERLRKEFPALPISLHVVETDAPNAKVGVLSALAAAARYPVLLVNDSDIDVPAGYLRAVAQRLEDPGVGLVTCLYRATADSLPGRAEALGIATEFAPSVMVARLLGLAEFALGSTMAFRAATLGEIGGFAAISDYLADDYQLGNHISRRGYHVAFAPCVVETNLSGESWPQVWKHQLRWSRTMRVSRTMGYFGYVVTHATLWAVLACAAGQWWAGAIALAVRMLAGIWVGAGILEDREVALWFWLIPVRDLFGFAVWLAGLAGKTVDWRGQKLHLQPDGRICKYGDQAPNSLP